MEFIPINKPTRLGVIIPALQIILCNFCVIIVATVSVWIDICNTNRILRNGTYAPRVVGLLSYSLRILINDGNYVALQILEEIVGRGIVDDTANAVLVVVEGNEGVILFFVPFLAENLGTVEGVSMENSIHRLARANTVRILGVGIAVEGLKLSALIIPFSLLSVKKNSAPEGAENNLFALRKIKNLNFLNQRCPQYEQ